MGVVTIDRQNRTTGEINKTIYQPVSDRVRDFRKECPIKEGWGLKTEVTYPDDQTVKTVAVITDPHGRVVATGTAEEKRGATYINTTSAVENCETSAIGRALFTAGYGGGEFASADELVLALQAHKEMLEAEAEGIAEIQGGNGRGTQAKNRAGDNNNPNGDSNDSTQNPGGLPMIPGVQFSRDGSVIVAEGSTFQAKGLLKSAGFRWDADRKVWSRAA